eukprot:1844395-Prymnesium_polylepis.2
MQPRPATAAARAGARVWPSAVHLFALCNHLTRDACTSLRFPNVAGIIKPSQWFYLECRVLDI